MDARLFLVFLFSGPSDFDFSDFGFGFGGIGSDDEGGGVGSEDDEGIGVMTTLPLTFLIKTWRGINLM